MPGEPEVAGDDEDFSKRLRLLERDLDAVSDFVRRVVTTRDALRAAALSFGALAAGVAVSSEQWAIALIALPVVLVLGYQDALLSYLYLKAQDRAASIERLFQLYADFLAEVDKIKEALRTRFLETLEDHAYGINRSLSSPSFGDVIRAFFRPPFLYATLALILLALTLILWIDQDESRTTCLQMESGAIVELDALPNIFGGEVTLVDCPE